LGGDDSNKKKMKIDQTNVPITGKETEEKARKIGFRKNKSTCFKKSLQWEKKIRKAHRTLGLCLRTGKVRNLGRGEQPGTYHGKGDLAPHSMQETEPARASEEKEREQNVANTKVKTPGEAGGARRCRKKRKRGRGLEKVSRRTKKHNAAPPYAAGGLQHWESKKKGFKKERKEEGSKEGGGKMRVPVYKIRFGRRGKDLKL